MQKHTSQSFHAKPQGSLDERKSALLTAAEMVGKMLTVKFQELSETGVPRFPVAVGFRCDSTCTSSESHRATQRTRLLPVGAEGVVVTDGVAGFGVSVDDLADDVRRPSRP